MFDPCEIGSIKRPSNRKIAQEYVGGSGPMKGKTNSGASAANKLRVGSKNGNYKGGLCDDRRAYLTMKAREYRHAKNGPPSRGPYAD